MAHPSLAARRARARARAGYRPAPPPAKDSFTEVWGKPLPLAPCRDCGKACSYNDDEGPLCGGCLAQKNPETLVCA